MKKFFKFSAITLGIILIVLISLPFLIEGKIGDIIKKEGNKMVNAEFDFENLDISLIRNFPKASISLNGFWLKGIGEFQNDTLVKTSQLTVTVDIASLFGDSGFDISQIILDDTYIKAIMPKEGKANWDIMEDGGNKEEDSAEKKEEEGASSFKLNLQKLSIENLNVIFDDRAGKNYAEIIGMDAHCSGNFGADRSVIKFKTDIPGISYRMNGIPFVNKAHVKANLDVDADFTKSLFTLQKNSISINAIETGINGWVRLLDKKIDMDMKLNSNEIDFKEVLSLIPAIYTKDFKGLKTEGSAILSGYAKGTYQENVSVPAFDLKLQVKDAMFHYPSLPAGVEGINISAAVKNPGGKLDATIVNITPLSFVLAGNPFAINADIKTPISDPDFNISLKGKMDLGKIKDVYPLGKNQLNGIINSDASLAGKMSYLDKKEYERFTATGSIRLNDMLLDLENLPKIFIKQSELGFRSQYLQLSRTELGIGKNDLTVESRLENYLGFLFKGATIKGNLDISSRYFNLNDFMSDTPEEAAAAEKPAQTSAPASDTAATGVIKVPGNIDFKMDLNMGKVLLSNMIMEKVNGQLIVKDSKVDLKNISFNSMGGTIRANGAYSTPEKSAPRINAGFALSDMSFEKTFTTLVMVQKLVPIFKGLEGTFSGNIDINSELDDKMSPIVETMNAKGNISTSDLNLGNIGIIKLIVSQIPKASAKGTKAKDLNINFEVKNGRVETKPFNINIGDVKVNLAGTTGLDQSIDYKGKVTLPKSLSGTLKVETVDMSIGGTFSSPKIHVDMKSLVKEAAVGQAKSLLDKLINKHKK